MLLENKGIDIPIHVELTKEGVVLEFNQDKDIEQWKKNYNLSQDANPKEAISSLSIMIKIL